MGVGAGPGQLVDGWVLGWMGRWMGGSVVRWMGRWVSKYLGRKQVSAMWFGWVGLDRVRLEWRWVPVRSTSVDT